MFLVELDGRLRLQSRPVCMPQDRAVSATVRIDPGVQVSKAAPLSFGGGGPLRAASSSDVPGPAVFWWAIPCGKSVVSMLLN